MLQFFTKPSFSFLILAIFVFSANTLTAQKVNDALPSVSTLEEQTFSDVFPPKGFYSNNAKKAETGNSTITTVAPPNDLCEGAQLLSGDTVLEDVDITNATQNDAPSNLIAGRPPVCDPFSSNIGNGVWYTFVGSGDLLDFEVDDLNSSEDLEIALYTGTCGDLTCVAGSDNPESVLDFLTEDGTVYYIYIGSWAHFANPSGTFSFTLTGGVAEGCSMEKEMEIVRSEGGCDTPAQDRIVVVSFLDGVAPITYEVEKQGSTFITQKGASTYQVIGYGPWSITATDANGCSVKAESSELAYVSEVSSTNETGLDKEDGTASVEVTGGAAPYTVVWSNGTEGTIDASGGSHINDGLEKGNYEAVVTDADGQTSIACVNVGRNSGRSGRGRGRGKTADINEVNTLLAQPNPFTQTSTVRFSLLEDAFTAVQVFSLDGRQMDTLFEGQAEGGQDYSLELNAADWASGIYILKMTTDNGFVAHQRLFITK